MRLRTVASHLAAPDSRSAEMDSRATSAAALEIPLWRAQPGRRFQRQEFSPRATFDSFCGPPVGHQLAVNVSSIQVLASHQDGSKHGDARSAFALQLGKYKTP